MLLQIGTVADQDLVLIWDSYFSEIAKVFESFSLEKRNERWIDDCRVNRASLQSRDTGGHRPALDKGDVIPRRIHLEVIERNGGRSVRRTPDATHADLFSL